MKLVATSPSSPVGRGRRPSAVFVAVFSAQFSIDARRILVLTLKRVVGSSECRVFVNALPIDATFVGSDGGTRVRAGRQLHKDTGWSPLIGSGGPRGQSDATPLYVILIFKFVSTSGEDSFTRRISRVSLDSFKLNSSTKLLIIEKRLLSV